MAFPRTPADVAARSRKIRNELFDAKTYPYGDRQLNPQRKRTAYEYHEWARTQQSHHIQEGSYLGMLESEERAMGRSSYPEGHPRRETAMSGLPSGIQVHPDAGPTKPAEGFGSSPPDQLIQAATRNREPIRVNRFPGVCHNCGEKVLAGEGRMERSAAGWNVVHHPRCPT